MSVLTIFFSFGTLLKTRGHVYKVYKPQTTKTARKNFFAERVINVLNSLPPVVDFSSLACFKRTIINVDFTEFLKC